MNMAEATKIKIGGKSAAQGLDGFLTDLMMSSAPVEEAAPEQVGEIETFTSLDPSDAYAAQTIVDLYSTDFSRNYASKVENLRDCHNLLIADVLLSSADTDQQKQSLNAILNKSTNSKTLEINLKDAAEAVFSSLGEQDRQAIKETMQNTMTKGYLNANKSQLEADLALTYNKNSELRRHVSKTSNWSEGVLFAVIAATMAFFGYQSYIGYQNQMRLQQEFAKAIQTKYDIQVKPSFYEPVYSWRGK